MWMRDTLKGGCTEGCIGAPAGMMSPVSTSRSGMDQYSTMVKPDSVYVSTANHAILGRQFVS